MFHKKVKSFLKKCFPQKFAKVPKSSQKKFKYIDVVWQKFQLKSISEIPFLFAD